jgi:hypothetical protein
MSTSKLARVLSLLLPSALLAAAAASAATERTGQTPGGAYFRIAVPDGWAPGDGLVLWSHGYALDPPDAGVSLGPLVDRQLVAGYAVAASSFRTGGWALFSSLDDLRELVARFTAEFGAPGEVILTGASMGGLVSIQGVEAAGGLGAGAPVVAAYSLCGALAGSRIWDLALDLRLVYDAVCADVSGGRIPGGASGYPDWPRDALDEVLVGLAVQTCTGILEPPAQRSANQRRRLAAILELTRIPEELFLADLAIAVFGLSDLVHDPQKLGGAAALTNLGIVYGDPEVDREIARVAATAEGRARLLAAYTPTGAVGEARILALHSDRDGLVFVEHLGEYAALAPPAQLLAVVTRDAVPAHCPFSPAEVAAGWEELRDWLASGREPTAHEVQGRCLELAGAGAAAGPCRIDPAFELPRLGDRQHLRGTLAPCVADPTTLCLNGGRFRVRARWRTAAGAQGEARVVPLTADTGYLWFFDPANVEAVVKVLDGCPVNDRFWVFAGGLTDVAVDLEVEDTATGAMRQYRNPQRTAFEPLQDTSAFAGCP